MMCQWLRNVRQDGIGQLSIADLPDQAWDVIVVGAGPAGSVCAGALAKQNRLVLLVDREILPRDKTCGDLLTADAISLLHRTELFNDVRPDAKLINNIRVFSPGRIEFNIPGEFLSIRRVNFDFRLARAAAREGAILAKGYVEDIAQDSTGATVRVGDRELRCKVVVVATGAAVELGHRVGLVKEKQAYAAAIRFYVKSSYVLPDTILSYDRSLLPCYAWIVPVGPRLFNVGCGIRLSPERSPHHGLKRHLKEFLTSFPEGCKLMASGEPISKIAGAAVRCSLSGNRSLFVDRILAVGETISTTFPFTGEGIGKAMQSGLIAAEVIAPALQSSSPSLADYPKRIAREIQPYYHGYEIAERWLGRAWLNDFVSRRVTRSPFLQKQLQEFVSETGDPRKLFSVGSVLKSFWK